MVKFIILNSLNSTWSQVKLRYKSLHVVNSYAALRPHAKHEKLTLFISMNFDKSLRYNGSTTN